MKAWTLAGKRALITGGSKGIGLAAADEFLATQGDVWDTQWDMFLAVMGAVVALATLSRTHDRALARLLLQR